MEKLAWSHASLRDMKYDIIQMINKKGEPYHMLRLYLKVGNESVLVHEVFMRDNLISIFDTIETISKHTHDHD